MGYINKGYINKGSTHLIQCKFVNMGPSIIAINILNTVVYIFGNVIKLELVAIIIN